MIPDNLNHGKETQMVIQRSSSISTKQKKVMQISLRTHKFEVIEWFENNIALSLSGIFWIELAFKNS